MISCFIFYSPFCLMNLLQKIPLQFDEEQGLWILRRELAVSVSHHALHLCLFGSKFLSLQNCCAFNTWKKKKKTASSFEFLIRYQCWNYPIMHMPNFKKNNTQAIEIIPLWYLRIMHKESIWIHTSIALV